MPLKAETGKVTHITTNADGTTTVTIQDDNTNETFRHPSEMTDAQLAEFKRAQDTNRTVGVQWDEDGTTRKIRAITVFGAGIDRSVAKRAPGKSKKRRR